MKIIQLIVEDTPTSPSPRKLKMYRGSSLSQILVTRLFAGTAVCTGQIRSVLVRWR